MYLREYILELIDLYGLDMNNPKDVDRFLLTIEHDKDVYSIDSVPVITLNKKYVRGGLNNQIMSPAITDEVILHYREKENNRMIEINKDIKVFVVKDGKIKEVEIDGVRYVQKEELSKEYVFQKKIDDLNIAENTIVESMRNSGRSIGEALKKPVKELKKAENLLQMSKDNNILIGLFDESSRGIGKTTELIKLAYKEGATLVVGNQHRENLIKQQSLALGLDIEVRHFLGESSVRGTQLKHASFVVDEDVQYEVLRALFKNKYKLIGGFLNLNLMFNN